MKDIIIPKGTRLEIIKDAVFISPNHVFKRGDEVEVIEDVKRGDQYIACGAIMSYGIWADFMILARNTRRIEND